MTVLVDWLLVHRPSRGPATPERMVSVPHSAMRDMTDVRAGGVFEYRTTIEVEKPSEREILRFEAAGPDCVVTVNGVECARRVGLWGAFEVPVGSALHAGENVISVVVTAPDFDPDSPAYYRNLLLGIVPDVEGPFAGIWQPVHLLERSSLLTDLRIAADRDAMAIRATWAPGDPATAGDPGATVHVEVMGDDHVWTVSSVPVSSGAAIVVPEAARTWTPATPSMQRVAVRVAHGDSSETVLETTIGFRDVGARGKDIVIGGRPTYLRGVLHWGFYNSSGIPSTDPESTRRELESIVEMGFNTVKVCLFVAPEHFYDLCDELGIVVWQELPLWLPAPNPESSRRVDIEYPRLLDQLGRHPSIAIVSLGCELDDSISTELLDRHYALAHEALPGVLVCANSGSGEMYGGGIFAASDVYDYHFYGDIPYMETLYDRVAHVPRERRPWLFGEFNDADTWRTPALEGTDGSFWLSDDPAVNPLLSVHAGFDSDQPVYHQRRIIDSEGYAAEVDGLDVLSRAQSLTTRKLQLELTRRTDAISGYVVSELRDTHSTAVGMADRDGVPKYSSVFARSLNAEVVLTIESPLDRAWHAGGDRLRVRDVYNATAGAPHRVVIGCANAGAFDGEADLVVSLRDRAGAVASVVTRRVRVPAGRGRGHEIVLLVPDALAEGSVLHTVEAVLRAGDEDIARNEWDVFVHPVATPSRPLAAVFDPRAVLGEESDVDRWLGGPRLRDPLELADLVGTTDLLVTTELDAELRRAAVEAGVSVFAAGGSLFPLHGGSFWRENVTRVHGTRWVRAALPSEEVGTPHVSLGTGVHVRRGLIEPLVGAFTPHMSRYDTRKYTVGEYLFSWADGASRFTYSTLSHGAASSPQPTFACDHIVSRRLIDEWITDTARAQRPAS